MNKIVLYCILVHCCTAHGHTQDNQYTQDTQYTHVHIHINGSLGKENKFKQLIFDNKCILNIFNLPILHKSFTFRVDNK